MKPTVYLIRIQSLEFFRLVINLLRPRMGSTVGWKDDNFETKWKGVGEKPAVCIRFNADASLRVTYDRDQHFRDIPEYRDAVWLTWEGLFEKFSKPVEITVPLNKDYFATVTKESVVVGCQTFPIERVREILEAWEKVK